MRPANLKTKIFLDSGDPAETREALEVLGFLDGQTTNPSLIAKNPDVMAKIGQGGTFSTDEILYLYEEVVTEISALIPQGSVSIEVSADAASSSDSLYAQGARMFEWIPNAHIKYPTDIAGLEAAARSIATNMRVNMTLVFSQEQCAAVYSATRGAYRGDVFVSPFIGRLDDIGINGLDLIKNCMEMFKATDHHVEVLAASIRTAEHLKNVLALGVDIVTVPLKVIKEWVHGGMEVPSLPAVTASLKPIQFIQIPLDKDYHNYNISHDLTDKGLAKFVEDWNKLLGAR